MENKPVIMVTEDEKAISDFLRARLEADGYRVLPVFTGKEAISLASSHCPDLVLLDLGLPDIDGTEVLTAIRGWSAVPIIVVSARQQEQDVVQALDAGADDYITKPFSNSVLMARVRTALRKGAAGNNPRKGERTFDGGALRVDYDKRLVTAHGEKVHVTPIEYKLLVLLSQHAGRVMTYAVICRELWGPHVGDNRAVRVNMANLRRKIEKNAADPRYILTEVGIGYRMVENDETEGPE